MWKYYIKAVIKITSWKLEGLPCTYLYLSRIFSCVYIYSQAQSSVETRPSVKIRKTENTLRNKNIIIIILIKNKK